eukprot:PhM_4_TR5668/c0_g1_i1/m.69786
MRLSEYVRRALRLDLMDFDASLSQMVQLLTAPSQVFRMAKARKMTKNCYARDDPAFVVLQITFLVIAVIAWGIAVQSHVLSILKVLIFHIVVLYIGCGVAMALLTWTMTNKFCMSPGVLNEVRRDVEVFYCWDVHTSAYFVLFFICYVMHYFLLPILYHVHSVSAAVLSNLLFGAAASGYLGVTFLGVLELPFLTRQQLFLYPIAAIWVAVVLISFAGYNLSVTCVHLFLV